MALLHNFNALLDRTLVTPIDMERFHRSLQPLRVAKDPPRDVICCIVNYPLKEEILRRAREGQQIAYHDAPLQLFHDLSAIILKQWRALRPLLTILREQNIVYRWRFHFGLCACVPLRYPHELPLFYETLRIRCLDLPEWMAQDV